MTVEQCVDGQQFHFSLCFRQSFSVLNAEAFGFYEWTRLNATQGTQVTTSTQGHCNVFTQGADVGAFAARDRDF